jgi:glycosyltransferase involved in cell wall biosynthesis
MRLRTWLGRAERLLERTLRRARRIDDRVVRLAPAGEAAGRAVFSYIVDPFLLPPGREVRHSHTHFWESLTIGRTLAKLGFAVDVLHWTNRSYTPAGDVDLLVDVRLNLERLAPLAGPRCVKVQQIETAHWRTNNGNQLARLADLARRRGIELPPYRLVEENRALDAADAGIVLGNEFTIESYADAGKPLWRVPISNPFLYPEPDDAEIEGRRRRFVYFGGIGFVHKGLDLVLEAFAGAPELELLVCAPVERERDFARAFARELHQTPNIRCLGWQDVGRPRFLEIARGALATVFPSCSEGGGGSVVTAMHTGLIPVVTRETSVDVAPCYGVLLGDAGVETIRAAVRELAARPGSELAAMSRAAREQARRHHTRERFAVAWREAIVEILERFRPELAGRLARGS